VAVGSIVHTYQYGGGCAIALAISVTFQLFMAAVLKLGVATRFRVARLFLRVAKMYQNYFIDLYFQDFTELEAFNV
jgi:hypothetical protein